MKRIKRFISTVLCALLVLSALPVASLAASPEIWPDYPGVDQLPAINTIPDPFKFFDAQNDPNGDGTVSSPGEWTARRDEIKELVQHYWLGYRWPTRAEDVVGEFNKDVAIPYAADVWGTKIPLRSEFDKLAAKLLVGPVVVNTTTFGPAANSTEATQMAIDAWNAGYSVTIKLFGWLDWGVTLKDTTGPITEAPALTIMVKRNVVTVTNPDTSTNAEFYITITTPTAAQMKLAWGSEDAQAPVVIDIGGTVGTNDQKNALAEQGYALISFNATDIYPDASGDAATLNRDGVYTKLYPYNKDVYEYASGAEMAWGWAASQIISALEQTTPDGGGTQTFGREIGINAAKTLVTGHSRFGKAALFAGAFDDRISITFASESGGSGIQSNRYKVEGKIFNFNVTTYPKADRVYGRTEIPTVSYGNGNTWFPENAGQFVKKDNQLPFDSGEIISLIAPRPFFTTTGIDAHWLGNEGGVASMQAASEVYAYIGRNAIEKSNLAVRARQSDHAFYNRDFPFVIAMMDREFKQTSDTTLHVKDLFTTPAAANWNISYPAKDYNFVSELNSYPFDINSSYLPWSRPDKYTLWTAQENFLVGYAATITAHSNAPDVKLYLPDKTTMISASSHSGDVFTFNLTKDQAVYGRYELRTVGAGKEARSVFFAAVSLSDALRHATSKGDEGEENRLIGFSSRLANSPADPPQVFVGARTTPVSMSFTTDRFCAEDTTLMEYGVNFHDGLFARIANEGWDTTKTFDIKNLKFVTIPDFTFEISFGNITASAGNSGKDGAASFTQPISWNVEKFNNGPADVWPVAPDNQTEKDTLNAGGTITRPDAPAPKATAFSAKIVNSRVQHVGSKTNVVIDFDSELDTREFGFGIDVTNSWNTAWSADKKQVTLSIDYNKFPEGSSANVIIFRLKDTDGNMIPGPIYLPLSLQAAPDPDIALVNTAVTSIQGGIYLIPLANQSNQATKTSWVQAAVNARIPAGNGSTATVTYNNGYTVSVTKGLITKPAAITVTELDNSLSSLTVSAGTLTPAFSSTTTSYSTSVSNSVSSITVTPVARSVNATITVNGRSVTSSQTSQAISLNVGSNTISIIAITPDGASKTYTITVNRAGETTGGGNESPITPSPSPSATPAPTPAPAPATVTVQATLSGNTGTIKLDDATARDLSAKNTTIIVPAIAGATAYSVGLPAAALTSGQGGGALTLSAATGKITIPDNMLTGSAGISGKEVGITIGQVNKADLPADVKAALGNRPLVQLSLSVDGKQTEWNNPNAPVAVSIPYVPTQEELKNPENIVVWYIDGNGKAVTVPNGRYDAGKGTVTFNTTHFSLYAVSYVQKSFSDLGNAAWAKKSIEVLAAKDIVKTPSATAYNPAANITRADFLYSLIRTLGASAKISGNFDDVSKSAYYYNEIAIAKALGITIGEGNNKFGPDSSITRQDMMVMTERTLKLLKKVNQQSAVSVLDKFTDKSSIASDATNSVAVIVKEGLIIGSNNKINPTGNTTRAEAAVFLYRVYNKY